MPSNDLPVLLASTRRIRRQTRQRLSGITGRGE
jgi:hypothetical protein